MDQMDKKERRRQARQKLAALPEQALAGRGRLFAERLTALPEYRQARTIFCYLSVEREPDTAPILRQALAEGKVVCAPVCLEKGLMRARRLLSLEELEKGPYGIPAPPESQPWIEPEQIDFAVVPCMACDEKGGRLGHGAGFYDRFLAQSRFFRAALCHEELLLPQAPTDPLDQPMDCVITQERTLRRCQREGAGLL
jgi:5-formyltetrahydrofolate cyclo-ligase